MINPVKSFLTHGPQRGNMALEEETQQFLAVKQMELQMTFTKDCHSIKKNLSDHWL